MIAGASRSGWQTTLADLALILFMVTAAAMAETSDASAPEPVPVAGAPVPAGGEPLAIYRAAPGAPSLGAWLSGQPRDDRQHLTIVARHAAGDAAQSMRGALALAREAEAAGRTARIVVEPAAAADLIAVLDYDGRESGTAVARPPASTNGAARAANER
ncbi:hypothetical protein [Pelagerythrobacter sp.]|uniref:hypothetical protein n=1 Tax=Pelagerythrobacter sp. TaxID=2800702 RepID=UPI0035B366BB